MTETAATAVVLLDHTPAGALRAPSRELCTAACQLAGTSVTGVWVLVGDEVAPTADALAELGRLGVPTVRVVQADGAGHQPLVVAQALTALVGELAADGGVVLTTSSFENKEALARVAVRTGAAVVTDADRVEVADGRLVVGKTVFAGTWTTSVAARTPLALVALKSNSVTVVETEGPAAQAVPSSLVPDAVAAAVEVLEHTERPASERPDLGSAGVVVVGGRGTDGDFSAVEELADVLGGAVGATRVATDEGWIGHDAQIGQTGVTVSPRLYIGAGVSGAVHHRGGMQASGTIVAVNSDPDAPIFEIADFGVVGDLFTVLPQAAAELRRLKG